MFAIVNLNVSKMKPIFSFLKRIDLIMIIIIVVFAIISINMISSITATAEDPFSSFVMTQTIAFIIGAALVIFFVAIDYKAFLPFEKYLYILAILIQLTVYIPGLGIETAGQRAWINLFGITTLQPSEFVKILFVLVMSGYLSRRMKELVDFAGFLKAFLYGLPMIGIVAVEDTGAGIVMMFMHIGLIFVAGLKTGLFVRLVGAFVILVPILYRFLDDYQKDRFTAFLHPDNLEMQATMQVRNAKLAIGNGGFFGKGFREGTIKQSDLLPVQESDFIFPIICEEFGLFGGLGIIALYLVFISRIWFTIAKATEMYGALICAGFMCMFGFQIFENIGMTLGIMPITGITLPFLSAGGTSIIANMIAIGLILGINYRDTSRSIHYS